MPSRLLPGLPCTASALFKVSEYIFRSLYLDKWVYFCPRPCGVCSLPEHGECVTSDLWGHPLISGEQTTLARQICLQIGPLVPARTVQLRTGHVCVTDCFDDLFRCSFTPYPCTHVTCRVECVSWTPRVFIHHNLLTAAECNHMKRVAAPQVWSQLCAHTSACPPSRNKKQHRRRTSNTSSIRNRETSSTKDHSTHSQRYFDVKPRRCRHNRLIRFGEMLVCFWVVANGGGKQNVTACMMELSKLP